MATCRLVKKPGWWCSRKAGHPDPCALHIKWWNIVARGRLWMMF